MAGAGRRWTAPAVAVLVGLAAACTDTSEIDLEAERRNNRVEAGDAPHWITAGRALAAADAEGAAPTTTPSGSRSATTAPPTAAAAEVLGALTAAGVPASAARCVADRTAGDPSLAADVRSALGALASGGGATVDPAVLRRVTTAAGPCFDANSLAALVVGGAGGGTTATTAAGADATASTIPAGLQQLVATLGATVASIPDLSKVNPLTLLDRGQFVASARTNGLSANQAGCLYDRLGALSPDQLKRATATPPDPAASGTLVTTVLGCLVRR